MVCERRGEHGRRDGNRVEHQDGRRDERRDGSRDGSRDERQAGSPDGNRDVRRDGSPGGNRDERRDVSPDGNRDARLGEQDVLRDGLLDARDARDSRAWDVSHARGRVVRELRWC